MYSVRTFTTDGVETNKLLGKEYKVVRLDDNPQHPCPDNPFQTIYNKVFNANEGLDTNVKVFIVGDITVPIYAGESAYIMSPNGQTFSKISDR